MKESSHFLAFVLSLTLISSAVFSGCSNSSDYIGEPPEIDSKHYIITFHAADQGEVIFTHKDHADYYDNTCMACHMHTDVRDDTIWSCSECHDNEDSAGLCVDDNWNHDCMFVQCDSCHKELSPEPDPTPACTDCHLGSPPPPPPPPPSGGSYTIYGSIDSQDEVDHYEFQLSDTVSTDVTIDVLSVESDMAWFGSHHPWNTNLDGNCQGCHDIGGPADLGFPNPNNSNGSSNDKLYTNIYLFIEDQGVYTYIDHRGCQPSPCSLINTPGCFPGCDDPNAGSSRNERNPILHQTLGPGNYVLRIGSAPLSQQDALAGVNSDGSYYSSFGSDTYDYKTMFFMSYIKRYYKIIISITPN